MSKSRSTSGSCAGVNRGWVDTNPCDCACECDDKSICNCEQYLANKIACVEMEMVPLYQKEILGNVLTAAKIPPAILYIADTIQAYAIGQILLAPILPTNDTIRRFGRICAEWLGKATKEINDVTHDAVEIEFKCTKCTKTFYLTLEINMGGKSKKYGHYVTKCVRRDAIKMPHMTLNFAMDIFEQMSGRYCLVTNNCKIWSRKFIDRFTLEHDAIEL